MLLLQEEIYKPGARSMRAFLLKQVNNTEHVTQLTLQMLLERIKVSDAILYL